MSASEDPTALERLLRDGSDDDVRAFLRLVEPPLVADLIEALSAEEDRRRAFRLIIDHDRPRVLRDLEEDERGDLLGALPPSETAELLEALRTDDAADVLQELDEATQQAVLAEFAPTERAALEEVLTYPAESAGGIMQTELVKVQEGWTARAAVEEIRRTRDQIGELHEIFVVDRKGQLAGWIKERDLILADDHTRVREVTSPVPIRIPADMDQEEIAGLVADYDLSSVPVVDEGGRLVGRILVDDIVDVLEEEATEDIARLVGTQAEEIYQPSVARALRARSPWLVVTFVGDILAAIIISAGDDLVKQAGLLVAFMPVIMGVGGGSAAQTATVTVRGLTLGRINPREMLLVVRKEALVGLLLALGAAAVLWSVAYLLDGQTWVAGIAAAALFGTVCLGTIFGVATPLVLERVGVDPAVATSPFVTTMNDLLGSTLILLLCKAALT